MTFTEIFKQYLPFVLAVVFIALLYFSSLFGGEYVKPKGTILNESIGSLAYPKSGILKEMRFSKLEIRNKTTSKLIANYGSVEISNSWRGKNFWILNKYLKENISYLKIDFSVIDSQGENDLFFSVNGERIWSHTPRGKHSIIINESFLKSGQNEIILGADTNWKFWKPTVYHLEGLRVNSVTKELKFLKETFNIPKFKKFSTRATLSFFVEKKDNLNPLYVSINKFSVFSSPVTEKRYFVDLSEELKANNTLKLSTHSNLISLKDVLIQLYYKIPLNSYKTEFTISKREHEYLASGISKAKLDLDLSYLKKGKVFLNLNNETIWEGGRGVSNLDISNKLKPGKNQFTLNVSEGVYFPNLSLKLT